MNDTTRAAGDDLILVAIAGAWIALEAAATVLVMTLALLLVLAGWRPSQTPQSEAAVGQTLPPRAIPVVITPMPEPVALPPAADTLSTMTVMQLRQRARAAGLAQLARSGRRAQLLEALAV